MERPQPTEKPLTREEVLDILRKVSNAGVAFGVDCAPSPKTAVNEAADAIPARLPTLDAAVVERLNSATALPLNGGQWSSKTWCAVRIADLRALLAFKGVGR